MVTTELDEILDRLRLRIDRSRLASMIDATLLSPSIRLEDAIRLIEATQEHGFYCAMLPPHLIPELSKRAERLGVRLCSVVGFPYGYAHPEAKAREAEALAESGVAEIDMVANISAILNGHWELVERDIRGVVDAAREYGVKVKVIVEAPLLGDSELGRIVEIVAASGAEYAKTSTGVLSKGGDPVTTLRLYRVASPLGLKVKAAGGIRTGLQALLAIAAGASRIGTSSPVEVLETSGLG